MPPAVHVAVAVVVVVLLSTSLALAENPDVKRSGPELITSKGYPLETHFVTTPDDYVLRMLRMPRANAPAVLLQHGFLDSSDTWVLLSAKQSLAFILFDAGFDVWLGNSRGNKYSRNNTKHSPNWPFDAQFWDFDWDAMAEHDVPTQVDYVLQQSGRAKLVYVGHSQGTTQMFANLATPGWSVRDKVSLFVALAPVVHLGHTGSLFIKALATLDVDRIVQFLGFHEFLGTNKIFRWLLPKVCEVTPVVCDSAIYLFAGLDLGDLPKDRVPVLTSHFPSGTSVRDVVKWGQAVRSGKFQHYDHGLVGNLLKYHQTSPPQYNLTNVDVPTALFYGGQDDLADPTDVKKLLTLLPASTIAYANYTAEYAHLDFTMGAHAYERIYPDLVRLAKQHSN